MTYTVLVIITAIFLLPGAFMALIPMLPALTYMFVVALVFGLYDGFIHLTANETLILLTFVIASIAVDYLAGILGAKYSGATNKSLLWGIGGSILGTFMLPFFGSLLGLFVGVALAELYYGKSSERAAKSAGGALLGGLVGITTNIALALAFIITFLFFAL